MIDVSPRSLAVVSSEARLRFAGPAPTPIRSLSTSTLFGLGGLFEPCVVSASEPASNTPRYF